VSFLMFSDFLVARFAPSAVMRLTCSPNRRSTSLKNLSRAASRAANCSGVILVLTGSRTSSVGWRAKGEHAGGRGF